jgi:hypothetical protein
MTQKSRIEKLEAATEATGPGPNPYMTMPKEEFINLLVGKMAAAQRGECQPVDLSQAGETLRAEIARRLQRIAEVQQCQ